MRVCLTLSGLFKGIDVTKELEKDLVGTIIRDERGKKHGQVVKVDKEKDLAWCDLYDGPLKDKIIKNYQVYETAGIVGADV